VLNLFCVAVLISCQSSISTWTKAYIDCRAGRWDYCFFM